MTYDKKYEMTANTKIINGRKLFQIKAVVDFSNVKAGMRICWTGHHMAC